MAEATEIFGTPGRGYWLEVGARQLTIHAGEGELFRVSGRFRHRVVAMAETHQRRGTLQAMLAGFVMGADHLQETAP